MSTMVLKIIMQIRYWFHNWFSIEEQKWKSILGIGYILVYTQPSNLYRDGDTHAVLLMRKLFFLEAMQVTLFNHFRINIHERCMVFQYCNHGMELNQNHRRYPHSKIKLLHELWSRKPSNYCLRWRWTQQTQV